MVFTVQVFVIIILSTFFRVTVSRPPQCQEHLPPKCWREIWIVMEHVQRQFAAKRSHWRETSVAGNHAVSSVETIDQRFPKGVTSPPWGAGWILGAIKGQWLKDGECNKALKILVDKNIFQHCLYDVHTCKNGVHKQRIVFCLEIIFLNDLYLEGNAQNRCCNWTILQTANAPFFSHTYTYTNFF